LERESLAFHKNYGFSRLETMDTHIAEPTTLAYQEVSKPGLFRSADGKSFGLIFVLTMGGGKAGLYAVFATFFFMSVGFPTISALAIRALGEHAKLASSLIVMSIVGGAIVPSFMGHIADRHSMRIGFVAPLICFVFVALYGFIWAKLSTLDSLPPGENLK